MPEASNVSGNAVIKAFVARSFDEADEPKVRPITEFLSTYADLGLIWQTAERAEANKISSKVTRLIDDSHAFVGVFTVR